MRQGPSQRSKAIIHTDFLAVVCQTLVCFNFTLKELPESSLVDFTFFYLSREIIAVYSVTSERFIYRADLATEGGQIKKIGIRVTFPTCFRHRHDLIKERAGKHVSGHAHARYCTMS